MSYLFQKGSCETQSSLEPFFLFIIMRCAWCLLRLPNGRCNGSLLVLHDWRLLLVVRLHRPGLMHGYLKLGLGLGLRVWEWMLLLLAQHCCQL